VPVYRNGLSLGEVDNSRTMGYNIIDRNAAVALRRQCRPRHNGHRSLFYIVGGRGFAVFSTEAEQSACQELMDKSKEEGKE
jgi:hypothetical protein